MHLACDFMDPLVAESLKLRCGEWPQLLVNCILVRRNCIPSQWTASPLEGYDGSGNFRHWQGDFYPNKLPPFFPCRRCMALFFMSSPHENSPQKETLVLTCNQQDWVDHIIVFSYAATVQDTLQWGHHFKWIYSFTPALLKYGNGGCIKGIK